MCSLLENTVFCCGMGPFLMIILWVVGPFSGSPSLLGIAEFIVLTGSFFHAQTPVSFHIIEELSPNVRMILKS